MDAIAQLVARERTPEVRDLWNKMVDDLAQYEASVGRAGIEEGLRIANRQAQHLKELRKLDPVAYEAWKALMRLRR